MTSRPPPRNALHPKTPDREEPPPKKEEREKLVVEKIALCYQPPKYKSEGRDACFKAKLNRSDPK